MKVLPIDDQMQSIINIILEKAKKGVAGEIDDLSKFINSKIIDQPDAPQEAK